MNVVETIYFAIGSFIFINFFFALLYLLSRRAGDRLFDGLCKYSDCLGSLLILILLGLTNFVAMLIYDRFNWFVARLVMLLYAALLFISFFIFLIIIDA
ncbi:hypothetical protein FZC76_13795 [Sutcliffiella horikoshii]|uniref:Uncharacterized protein n=1 Tax=Sutcliffiella horikoshii TaxID=79883 RepID=A0A5D4SW66_9BACI|nr:hypothetical protein [Sutcliffiella horikoshii]TYS67643.1 hypothetical protein FZC76_13795 [Sutcliffiella horikoshii]